MQDLLDRLGKQSLIRIVLLGVLGLLLILIPGTLIDIIVYIIAVFFIIAGVLLLYSYVRDNGWAFDNLGAWMGPAMVLAGILILCFARPLISMLPIFLGLVLVAGGGYYLYIAITSTERKWMQILFPVLLILFGLVIVFHPFGTITVLLRIFGAVLLVACVYELYGVLSARKG